MKMKTANNSHLLSPITSGWRGWK